MKWQPLKIPIRKQLSNKKSQSIAYFTIQNIIAWSGLQLLKVRQFTK